MKPAGAALAAIVPACALVPPAAADPLPYRSPYDAAFSPDGATLAVSDRTAGRVYLIDPEERSVRETVALRGEPAGLAWSSGGPDAEAATLYIAEHGAGSVAAIDVEAGEVRRRLEVGLRPVGLAVVPGRGLLLAANTVTHDVSVVDLARGEETARVRVPREPFFLAVSKDATRAVVGNLLPAGSAADPAHAAVVSVLDLKRPGHVTDIPLPPGSTSVREVAISPDGRWAYAVHTIGRFRLPVTQLDRGWVNTNALSVVDLDAMRLEATVLLDHPYEGATDPWGLALSPDGDTLWVSLRGVHEVARVELGRLHRLLRGDVPPSLVRDTAGAASSPGVWGEIRRDPARKRLLADDLSALHVADLIETIPAGGRGPRGLDLSPDGRLLAVAGYYSGEVVLIDPEARTPAARISLGPSREPDAARRGEALFHDATLSFQRWLSCSTCHPDDGRSDALRWDLPNDGLGTPQRTRSLLLSHRIRPTTARGVRSGVEASVSKGLFFFLHEPDPGLAAQLIAYIESLQPEPSPYLIDGELSGSARRGEAIFRGKGKCTACHEGELGTDLEPHDVGTQGELDREDELFYTPKLVELYRTAPFLHDGRAATLEDVFTRHDPEGKHGGASRLDAKELDDLVEYLRSR